MGKFNLYNMLKQSISSLDENEEETNEEKKEPDVKQSTPVPEVKKPERKKYSAYRTIISRHEQASARIDKQEKAYQPEEAEDEQQNGGV